MDELTTMDELAINELKNKIKRLEEKNLALNTELHEIKEQLEKFSNIQVVKHIIQIINKQK